MSTTNSKLGGRTVKNLDVRDAVSNAGLRLWQIADKLGVADCNFSRKLRHELPDEEKERIFSIIAELSEGVG